MAVEVLSNKKNSAVTLHFSGANTTVVVPGNNSVSGIATDDEILTGANVTKIAWGLDTGSVQILRGANVISTHSGSGIMDFSGNGIAITKDNTASLVVNFVGTANGTCIVECSKVGSGSSEYLVG